MQGAYGGLIIILGYTSGASISNDYFLYLDGNPFGLLNGENLNLL